MLPYVLYLSLICYSSSFILHLHPFFVLPFVVIVRLSICAQGPLTRPVCVTPALVVGIAQRHTIATVLTRVQLAWFDLFVAKPSHVPVLAFALEAIAAGQNAFAKNAIAQIAVGERTERSCMYDNIILSGNGVT